MNEAHLELKLGRRASRTAQTVLQPGQSVAYGDHDDGLSVLITNRGTTDLYVRLRGRVP